MYTEIDGFLLQLVRYSDGREVIMFLMLGRLQTAL